MRRGEPFRKPKPILFGHASKLPKRPKPKNFAEAGSNEALAIQALRDGLCLTLSYDGCCRVVEVHTVGITTAGRAAMCAFQVEGQTNTPPIPDWRMFCFDDCFDMKVSPQISEAPRFDYKRDAKQFRLIKAQL